jgi:hypothetical protein
MAKQAPAWMVDDFTGDLVRRPVPEDALPKRTNEIPIPTQFIPNEADEVVASAKEEAVPMPSPALPPSVMPPPPLPAGPSKVTVKDDKGTKVDIIKPDTTAASVVPAAPILSELPDIIVKNIPEPEPSDYVDEDPLVKELVKGKEAPSPSPASEPEPESEVESKAEETESEAKASDSREVEVPLTITPTEKLPAIQAVESQDESEDAKDIKLFLKESCVELNNYLNSINANFGSEKAPSDVVQRIQRVIGVDDTGIMNPETRTACEQISGITLPSRSVQRAAPPLTMPTADLPVGITTNETPPVVVNIDEVVEPEINHGNKDHECVYRLPGKLSHLQPIFTALQQAEAANPTLTLGEHFLKCKGGLLGNILRESGGSWTAITKERPRAGSSDSRYSYGPIQILDDTARSLYKWRHLLGDDSTLIRKPPDDDKYVGKIDPRLKAILCDPTNGAWYIALFVTRLENWASTFFDLQRLQDEGVLSPGGSRGLAANKKEAEAISKYINDKVKLESRFTPQILLLRMYAGASSIKGMANNIKNGHTDKSLNNLLKNIKIVESMTV